MSINILWNETLLINTLDDVDEEDDNVSMVMIIMIMINLKKNKNKQMYNMYIFINIKSTTLLNMFLIGYCRAW